MLKGKKSSYSGKKFTKPSQMLLIVTLKLYPGLNLSFQMSLTPHLAVNIA